MAMGKLPGRGVLRIWIRVGQRPTALAVGAGGVVWMLVGWLLLGLTAL